MNEREVKLKKLVKELEKKRGRNTELVSVIIPAGHNINEVANQIAQEKSTAENIKSKQTRKNVVAALEKIERFLSGIQKTPENGLAIFCGNVSENEGESDIRLWWIEPPKPLRVKLYWCGQEFKLEPLKEMLASKDVYGIICLDKNEADIAILSGKQIIPQAHFDSIVPGKTRAGGQSSARFSRIREALKHDFLKQVGEAANKIFERYNLVGIIISGTGMVKYEFAKGDYLQQRFKDKIIGIVDTAYTGEYGLQETLERADDLLRNTELMREKKILQEFFSGLTKKPPLSVYGLRNTLKALEMGAVKTLIISEDLEIDYIIYEDDGRKEGLFIEGERPKGKIIEIEDGFDRLEEMAKQYSTEVVLVSSDTREGNQFMLMGGIGGILRYGIEV